LFNSKAVKIYYNPKLKAFSRKLRNNSTLAEVLLWNELKARKMLGYQFMRQKPIGEYIVDFYCSELKLVIEVDGESHRFKLEKDMKRHQWLEKLGLNILRFDDLEVKKDMKQVLRTIENWIRLNS
jgi:very-short-patch-repair endonuclease